MPHGRFHLTPLHDVLSAHPVVGKGRNQVPTQELQMAMAAWGKNRHYRWDQIRTRHWRTTAKDCGLGEEVDGILARFVERTPEVVETIQEEAKEIPAEVRDPVLSGIEAAVSRLD